MSDIQDLNDQINSPASNVYVEVAAAAAKKLGNEGITKSLRNFGYFRTAVSVWSDFDAAKQAAKDARNAVDDPDIYHTRDDNGKLRTRNITFRPKGGKEEVIILVQPPNAYPIIFIPDFMGSNLKNKKDERVWNADRQGRLADTWEKVGADKRKAILEPSSVMVDQNGEVTEHATLKPEEIKRRGWGSVSYYLYGPFLAWLEDRMNDFEDAEKGTRAKMAELSKDSADDTNKGIKTERVFPEKPKLDENAGFWERLFTNIGYAEEMRGAAMMGGIPVTKNIYSLTEDQFKNSYRYRYPVYAFGYNWMQDNEDAVKALKQFVQKTCDYEKNRLGSDVSKVIFVTHGSGGLIARKFAKLNPDLVKGIVFGAMPATGMPETYKRIKQGCKRTFTDSASESIKKGVGKSASNFITETLWPQMKDPGNIATAATVGVIASGIELGALGLAGAALVCAIGGPLVLIGAVAATAAVAAGTAYVAAVGTSVASKEVMDVGKEIKIANDSIKDPITIEGKQAEDVAVVAAESIGYIQTLPFADYPVKKWLLYTVPALPVTQQPRLILGSKDMPANYDPKLEPTIHPKIVSYPEANPFVEIYLSLTDRGIYDENTMNPNILQNDKLYTQGDVFRDALSRRVKPFQDSIANFYTDHSYVFSGILSLKNLITVENNKESLDIDNDFLPGDGVVPYVSAKPAHDAAKEEAVFYFEHRKAFFDDASRLFVVSSITKMATS